jgi:hypothetical protein
MVMKAVDSSARLRIVDNSNHGSGTVLDAKHPLRHLITKWDEVDTILERIQARLARKARKGSK